MDNQQASPPFRQRLYANKRQWDQFLSAFLLASGIGFTVAGIIFFFAYNWNDLPKFIKLAIPEVAIVGFVLLSVFTRWKSPVKQTLLMGAAFLVGALFAVFGQIYQTGADAYDLFLGWTAFVFIWTLAGRSSPLWFVFIGLVCITIWLYVIQIVPDQLWSTSILLSVVTWICALATFIAERMKAKGILNKEDYWFERTLFIITIVYASYILVSAIFGIYSVLSVPLATAIILFSLGLWFGWKKKDLLYLATIPFAILLILLFTINETSDLSDNALFLFSGLYVIAGTTLLIYLILKLKKRWYGTEE